MDLWACLWTSRVYWSRENTVSFPLHFWFPFFERIRSIFVSLFIEQAWSHHLAIEMKTPVRRQVETLYHFCTYFYILLVIELCTINLFGMFVHYCYNSHMFYYIVLNVQYGYMNYLCLSFRFFSVCVSIVWFGLVLWHMDHSRLLMPNPFSYI